MHDWGFNFVRLETSSILQVPVSVHRIRIVRFTYQLEFTGEKAVAKPPSETVNEKGKKQRKAK